MMRVGEGDGEGVGGVTLNHAAAVQQHLHHMLHLRLFRTALADHRLLDAFCRILGDG